MKPKPFIQVNTNLSSCFTEKTEAWVGFATMVIWSLIIFFSSHFGQWTNKPLCSLPIAGHSGTSFLYENTFRESKGLLLVSPPTPSTITNLVSSPHRKLQPSTESNQNLLSWSLYPCTLTLSVPPALPWLWAGSCCSCTAHAGEQLPVPCLYGAGMDGQL